MAAALIELRRDPLRVLVTADIRSEPDIVEEHLRRLRSLFDDVPAEHRKYPGVVGDDILPEGDLREFLRCLGTEGLTPSIIAVTRGEDKGKKGFLTAADYRHRPVDGVPIVLSF